MPSYTALYMALSFIYWQFIGYGIFIHLLTLDLINYQVSLLSLVAGYLLVSMKELYFL